MFKIFSAIIQALHGGRGRAVAADHQTLRPLRQARVGRCGAVVLCHVLLLLLLPGLLFTTPLIIGRYTTGTSRNITSGMATSKVGGKHHEDCGYWHWCCVQAPGRVPGPLRVHSGMNLFRCSDRRTGQVDVTGVSWHDTEPVVIFSDHQMWQPQDRVQASAPLQSRPWKGEYLRVVNTHLYLCT